MATWYAEVPSRIPAWAPGAHTSAASTTSTRGASARPTLSGVAAAIDTLLDAIRQRGRIPATSTLQVGAGLWQYFPPKCRPPIADHLASRHLALGPGAIAAPYSSHLDQPRPDRRRRCVDPN